MTVNDIKCLDMATHNYLGFAGNVEIEKAAVETIRKYGVGSCGPRGFYGTVGKWKLDISLGDLNLNLIELMSDKTKNYH